MTTIISIFILSLALSLVITPLVGRVAMKFGVVDLPSERKIHKSPIPRAGGVSIFLAFALSILPTILPQILNQSELLMTVMKEYRLIYVAIGGSLIFALGFIDDLYRLGYKVKFMAQVLSALIAYAGGVKISKIFITGFITLHFDWYLSIPITVFWILLVVNSINLIDGLDGLAAGISFFACIVLLILCVMADNHLTAFLLAALGGSILGFLKYNFNPASIFMGDGGSYFIGYLLATFSIIGSIKSQAALVILIPMIALGLPLMDTIWAPIRRFMLGQHIFSPDKQHFHHKLLKLGLSHRTAVLTLYAVTAGAGIMAILMVHARDERAAALLIMIGVAIVFGVRKLGYFDYLKAEKVVGWFRDISDDTGISRERRSFLNAQLQISQARNMESLWSSVANALTLIEFDIAALYLNKQTESAGKSSGSESAERRKTLVLESSICLRKAPPEYTWTCPVDQDHDEIYQRCSLRIELNLDTETNQSFGCLVLLRDAKNGAMGHYTLKRVEHLRRNIISALENIEHASRESDLPSRKKLD